ncbi:MULTISPECIES: hypothetical protein [Hyphomicrobiales]|jgi:hypothetical protein|uniref:hypothetical protein n=1 Tax=Hyphomicrobiales TaxID=356 RepID=UPI00035E0159|nr:hypothetical protein [Afipia birgiae]
MHQDLARYQLARRIMLGVAALAIVAATFPWNGIARAAGTFRMLKGSEIRATLAGMELTDEVHWAYVFARSGTLTIYSMSRKIAGRWSVQQDQLCLDQAADDQRCYEVWRSGKTFQLRQPGLDIYDEGILQRPLRRN